MLVEWLGRDRKSQNHTSQENSRRGTEGARFLREGRSGLARPLAPAEVATAFSRTLGIPGQLSGEEKASPLSALGEWDSARGGRSILWGFPWKGSRHGTCKRRLSQLLIADYNYPNRSTVLYDRYYVIPLDNSVINSLSQNLLRPNSERPK